MMNYHKTLIFNILNLRGFKNLENFLTTIYECLLILLWHFENINAILT